MIAKRDNGYGKYAITHNGITTDYAVPLKNNISKGFVPIGIVDNIMVFREWFSDTDYSLVFYSIQEKRRVSDIEVPSIYYTVLHNRDKIFDKKVYQMLSTPDGVYLFVINHSKVEFNSTEIEYHSYPSNLDYRYHFNTPIKTQN